MECSAWSVAQGNVWEMFGKSLGNVWEMSGKCLGNLWEMFGKCLGNVARHSVARENT